MFMVTNMEFNWGWVHEEYGRGPFIKIAFELN